MGMETARPHITRFRLAQKHASHLIGRTDKIINQIAAWYGPDAAPIVDEALANMIHGHHDRMLKFGITDPDWTALPPKRNTPEWVSAIIDHVEAQILYYRHDYYGRTR